MSEIKFKITHQVPCSLRYEFANFEIEGVYNPDHPEGGSFADAVRASDKWAEEQRAKLSPELLKALDASATAPYGVAGGGRTAPPAPPRPPPSAAPAAPRGGHAPAPAAAPSAPAEYGPLGYPPKEYAEAIAWVKNHAHRGGYPCMSDPKAAEKVERDFVRAASVFGEKGFTIKNTLAEYAADIVSKGWDLKAVSGTWDRLEKLVKALKADGRVTLTVPTWSRERGGRVDQTVEYTVPLYAENITPPLPASAPAYDGDVPF
jgi:hypothetical protein